MNKQEKLIWNKLKNEYADNTEVLDVLCGGENAREKQMPKKVYHFLEDDTFETTCCGINVTNKDYKYCPECGCLLGEVEEVEGEDE